MTASQGIDDVLPALYTRLRAGDGEEQRRLHQVFGILERDAVLAEHEPEAPVRLWVGF